MSDRFYCPGASRLTRLRLDAEEAHHLVRVRRVGLGETVVCFDGEGYATRARVVDVGRNHVELQPEGDPLPDRMAEIQLTLLVAAPKGDRLEWLVEKATELGVAAIVPLMTERSVVDPRPAKLERLRRSVVEASKQCGRNTLMLIEPSCRWRECVHLAADARFIAHPSGPPLRRQPSLDRGSRVLLAIGPEGGFTDDEMDLAEAAGWRTIGLGATVLRVETAAIVGAAQVLMHVE